MTTIEQLITQRNIPLATAWYLADLGEARGKQELFTKQSPQRLKMLREHALIWSAIFSNRIEGVTVDQSRVKAVVLGKAFQRDRGEEEVRNIVMRSSLFINSTQGFPSPRRLSKNCIS